MPSGAGDDTSGFLVTDTEDLKTVSDYTGLDFEKCLALDIRTYKTLFRDAFIHQMKQTEQGREYLEECWTLQQTKPERNKLKRKFGGDAT